MTLSAWKRSNGYDLKNPCANCPFRTDVKPYLRPARAREIVESLSRGVFHCHKTIDYDNEDDDGNLQRNGKEQFCAGALIMMHKQGTVGQMARIAERIGAYDPDALDMSAPVFASSLAFIEAQPGGLNQHDTCSCCGPDCEWPAGFMTGAGVVRGEAPPEPLDTCPLCGEPTCEPCSTEHPEGGWCCLNCADDYMGDDDQ